MAIYAYKICRSSRCSTSNKLTNKVFLNALWERVVRPLQTVSNLLAAMREEDFSIRARGARGNDPLGEVLLEVNALADTLRSQRLQADAHEVRQQKHHQKEPTEGSGHAGQESRRGVVGVDRGGALAGLRVVAALRS